jgi:hypothetical protein
MQLEDIKPGHCLALASRLLAEVRTIREEMGRSEDTRPLPEVTGAEPRECYFEALGAWRKVARLAAEVGADSSRVTAVAPAAREVRPGHVHALLSATYAVLGDIRTRLGIREGAPEPTADLSKQPSDVLVTIIRVNRELSRALERPFTPSDVYGVVVLASAQAEALGAKATLAAFEPKRKPADCYAALESCLAKAAALVTKRGGKALAARGTPPEVLPGDVYDLAMVVLGELAFLGGTTQAFEPAVVGHRLPSHVHQLARTLDAQLSSLS